MSDTRIVPSPDKTYHGKSQQAVYAGERLLGHVYKDERHTPIMAKHGNYSVGTRVEKGWRFELVNVHPRVRQLDTIHDRDRFRRMSHGFERTRKAAVAEIVAVSGKLDEMIAWIERSRG